MATTAITSADFEKTITDNEIVELADATACI